METPVDLDLMPLLGEPLAVELANTAYQRPGSPFDFLATSEGIVHWFDKVALESPAALPRHLSGDRCELIRSLRDAVRSVLEAKTRGVVLPRAPLTTLSRFLDSSTYRVQLEWPDLQRPIQPTLSTLPIGRGFDAAFAFLALECASFVASSDFNLVLRCDGPDCPMFFVQHHHKRRFCHDGCAHRARQNRYYQSRLRAAAPA